MVASIPVNSSLNVLEDRLSNYNNDQAEEVSMFDDFSPEEELNFDHA